MTEIPEDIMQIAADTLDNALCHDVEAYGGSYEDSRNAAISDIARALMARDERAAKIADEHALDFERQAERQSDENMHDSLMRVADGCELVADAIRTHSEK